MFEKFTDRARRVVVLGQDEARTLNHNYIGTEHILLGLLHERDGVAAKALTSFGVSLTAVRAQVEDLVGRGTETPGGLIPFTPRAKNVLELSARASEELGLGYIGTEHILLGIINEGEGVAARILQSSVGDLARLRQKVADLLIALGLPAPPRELPPPAVQERKRVLGGNARARLLAGKANKLWDGGNKPEAVDLYAQAAALAHPGSSLWTLLQALRGDFLVELDRKREASLVLRELVDQLDDSRLYRLGAADAIQGSEMRTEVLSMLADLLKELSDSSAELEALKELAAAARESRDHAARGRALRRTADNLRRRGHLVEAIDTLNVAIAEAERISDAAGEAHAQVAAAYIEGRHSHGAARQKAFERAERARALYEHLGDKGDLANAYGLAGRLHRWSGNYPAAREAYERVVELLVSIELHEGAELARTEILSLPLTGPGLRVVAG